MFAWSKGTKDVTPSVVVDTFIAVSIYFTVFLIWFKFFLVLIKPGTSVELDEEEL